MRVLTDFAVLASLCVPIAASATDMTQPVQTFDGKDFVGQDAKPLGLTLDTVIESSLLTAPAPTEAEKAANYLLARKIHEHVSDYTPTPDEIVSIRKALAATQVTAVFGQIMVVLDPTFAPKK